MHADLPSWRHHRHLGRRRHGGSLSTTAGCISTVRFASRQSAPSKCLHPLPAQGAAKRKTSVGDAGLESSNSSSVAGCGSLKYLRRGSLAVPPTTPKMTLPSMSGCALGQSGVFPLATSCFGSLLRLDPGELFIISAAP